MDEYRYDTYGGSHVAQGYAGYPAEMVGGLSGFQNSCQMGYQAGMTLPNGQLVLVGLIAISKAVGAGPGTIKKWIKEENFPVRRCSDGIYRASPESVKAWFAQVPPASV
ncbi:MAG: hypothetical protein MI749_02710 [Desulfovibrionales bacterium]|nr:hypothetical protein [Desulfovibrionales bacterium]